MYHYLSIFLSIITPVVSDLVMEPPFVPPENYLSENNLIGLWAIAVCSAIGITQINKSSPIDIKHVEEHYNGKIYQKVSVKDGKSLHNLKKDLKEIQNAIDYLEKEEIEKIKKEKNIETLIHDDIKYKFGEGEIRSKKNGKYYHGIIGEEDKYKFGIKYWKENYDNCIWHYSNPKSRLPHKEWDTHQVHKFCKNCIIQPHLNKNRRTVFIYKCCGHEI